MKKFLALTLVAGFALTGALGCSSTPSTSKAAEGTKTKEGETKVQKGPESKTETKTEVKVTPETKTEVKTETKTETKAKP